MNARVSKYVSLAFFLTLVALVPLALSAQDSAKPATKAPAADSPSRWDIFLGYSALIPNAKVNGYGYNAIDYGTIASVTRYFNNHVGLQFEGDVHLLLPENGNVTSTQPQDDFSGGSGGLIFRFPKGNITPFVHALVGGEQVGSYYQTDVWGFSFTGGGGLDVRTPIFDHRLSVRLFQADYQYLRANFASDQGGSTNFNPQGRISAGLVLGLGSIAPPPPVTLACAASPASVFPGEPVTVTATAGDLNPKLNVIYSISGDGVTGTGATATVATAALAPGSYTVKCEVKEGKPGKEGLKPWQIADSSASYTVKAFEPPTLSCSASPSTIKPGETSTVTAVGMSPQNRPLTYSYTAAAGAISGSGTTATFTSTGAPTGATGITCNVSDDKGQIATASTSVTITAPYVAPVPHTEALCSITFEKDKRRPARVDNEAKACLDEVALDLQKQSDAKAVVVGNADAKEKAKTAKEEAAAAKRKHPKPVEDLAVQRAVNTKDYLVTEKGIDASRISVSTGTTDGQKVEDYLVPAGANFSTDVAGTTEVTATVKPQARKPLATRKHASKKGSVKPPQ
jgi:outer membrane protein OmpA-like peptidoglycan-associated protein